MCALLQAGRAAFAKPEGFLEERARFAMFCIVLHCFAMFWCVFFVESLGEMTEDKVRRVV